MVKILLTGATGYLGSYLARVLLREGHDILSLARRTHPLFRDQHRFEDLFLEAFPFASFVRKRITDFAPNAIVHLAAVTNINRCVEHPVEATSLHVALTEQLVEIANDCGSSFLFASTDQVFDGNPPPEPKRFGIRDLPSPVSTYARTKRSGELVTLEGSPSATVLRIALMYGAPIGSESGNLAWMHEALRSGKPVTLYSDEWRTPVYVEDVAALISLLIEKPIRGFVHAAGPDRLDRAEFGRAYAREFGWDPALVQPTSRLSHTGAVRPPDLSMEAFPEMVFAGIAEGLTRIRTQMF